MQADASDPNCIVRSLDFWTSKHQNRPQLMNVKSRKRYTAEFKAQAVALLETGKPIAEIAQELCISSDLLYSWRRLLQGS